MGKEFAFYGLANGAIIIIMLLIKLTTGKQEILDINIGFSIVSILLQRYLNTTRHPIATLRARLRWPTP